MSEDILVLLKENVIQGRKNKDDLGVDDSLSGQPGVVELVQSALDAGTDSKTLVEVFSQGMKIVGERFASKEYFIPDMLASAEAVSAAMDILEPHMLKAQVATKGKLAIATVKGDVHTIGKNIVAVQVKGAGYEVNNLGGDVTPEKIVEVVREYKPDFIGLSAMLTTTKVGMRDTIESLKDSGLRDTVKVLIGGTVATDEYAREIGADAYCADGFKAIEVLEKFKSSTK